MRTRDRSRTCNNLVLSQAPLPLGYSGLRADGRPRTGYLRFTRAVSRPWDFVGVRTLAGIRTRTVSHLKAVPLPLGHEGVVLPDKDSNLNLLGQNQPSCR
jgi:hypothetical protein